LEIWIVKREDFFLITNLLDRRWRWFAFDASCDNDNDKLGSAVELSKVSSSDESLSLLTGDISLSCVTIEFPFNIDAGRIGVGWRSDGWCCTILQPISQQQ